MRWIAQVGHVARKDVRQTWGMFALYVIAIAVATGGMVKKVAFGPVATESGMTLGMPETFVVAVPFALVLIATFTTATLVQLDSPTRPNALWATRPLSSSAVLTSKLLLSIGGLLGAALIGTAIALRTIDTSALTMTRILLNATLSSVECALAVLVVSALTSDMREFIGTLTTIVVGLVLFYVSSGEFLIALPTAFSATLAAFGVGSGLWFVIKLYRTHERQRQTWIVGTTIAAVLMFSAFMTPDPKPIVPTVNSAAAIQIEPTNPSEWVSGIHLPMKVRATPVADSVRLSFHPDTVSVRLNNNFTLQPDTRSYSVTVAGGALPWLGREVRWINVDSTLLEWPSTFTAEPSPWDRDSIAKHGARSIRVSGVMTVSRSRVVASLPLHENSDFVSDGRRVALYGSGDAISIDPASSAQVYIQLSAVERPSMIPQPENHLSERGNLQFALVNERRGEAMFIDAMGSASESTGAAVLPQVSIATSFVGFSTITSYSPRGRVPRDSAWYKDARLVVIEWIVVGNYRTSAEATVP
ncbi:MAG: hypothetical protein ABI852_05680 [Gemmatimonadaceae bacterium]